MGVEVGYYIMDKTQDVKYAWIKNIEYLKCRVEILYTSPLSPPEIVLEFSLS